MNLDLEISTGEQGQTLVRYRKRQLCSFIDPISEARQWVEHYRDEMGLSQSLVLLGLGAGHHVLEVKRNFNGKIVVIEKISQLIERFRSENPSSFLADIHFIELDRINGISDFESFKRPFGVMTFAPAIYSHLKEYEDLYALLKGRSPKNINEQFKLRGHDHFFCPQSLDTQSPAEMYKRLAHESSLGLRWQKIFKILGEIIR